MGRRNSKGRERVSIPPLPPDLLRARTPSPVRDVDAGDRLDRGVAKHAGSRTSGALYAKVRNVTGVLDDAEAHLERSELSEVQEAALLAQIASYRDQLARARGRVHEATTKRIVADELRDELSALLTVARLLPSTINSLVLDARMRRTREDAVADTPGGP